MDLVIRQAHEKDIAPMAALDRVCFSMPWSEASFAHEIKTNHLALYLVAEIGGVLVGYAGMWAVVDEGHITNIAVRKDYRGQGIGRLLTAGLMQYAANMGVQYMTLEVRKTNLIAQALYRKLHFIQLGVRKRYYEDNGEDALLYVCQEMPEAKENFTEEE